MLNNIELLAELYVIPETLIYDRPWKHNREHTTKLYEKPWKHYVEHQRTQNKLLNNKGHTTNIKKDNGNTRLNNKKHKQTK